MKKIKKNVNQKKSFYFEEYIEKSKKNFNLKFDINNERIYLLFFIFISLIFIFAIKIINISLQEPIKKNSINSNRNFNSLRNDITDRNGILLARNIEVYHAAIKPRLIKDKKKFLIKLKLMYPNINTETTKKKIIKK